MGKSSIDSSSLTHNTVQGGEGIGGKGIGGAGGNGGAGGAGGLGQGNSQGTI